MLKYDIFLTLLCGFRAHHRCCPLLSLSWWIFNFVTFRSGHKEMISPCHNLADLWYCHVLSFASTSYFMTSYLGFCVIDQAGYWYKELQEKTLCIGICLNYMLINVVIRANHIFCLCSGRQMHKHTRHVFVCFFQWDHFIGTGGLSKFMALSKIGSSDKKVELGLTFATTYVYNVYINV